MPKNINSDICEDRVFERIYNKYAQDLTNFLYYKFGAQLNPNDVTQESFIKLWNNCKTVSLNKAKSFLFTVANNIMLNEVKHAKVVLKYSKEKQKDYTNESPEFILEKDEFFQRYQNVLENTLTEEQRVAFLLNKVDGKRHSEIAELLGVTQKVVEYRIYSAFKVLKKRIRRI